MTSSSTSSTNTSIPASVDSPVGIPDILQLDRLGPGRFISHYHQTNRRRGIFGGQILSQALAAAAGTLKENRWPSELKILFLLQGTAGMPVTYTVDTLLEGGSFSIRRVRCEQETGLIADVTASFHIREQSDFEHQDPMPADIAPPEELANVATLANGLRDRLPPEAIEALTRHIPMELRPVHPDVFMSRPASKADLWYWAKPTTPISNEGLSHYCALAFMSDWWFSGSGTMRHTEQILSNRFFVTSLNHSVWFHRPPDVNDWLLLRSQSPSASGGRGFSIGEVWDRQGRRVASLAQEALARKYTQQHS